ncbi:MAG: TAXI family TRAP transporter solute-binding subunit [Proteobacteria bacterium]|nr:TAXI family TRAP transporter solute-binding subunit [Burkholderiales bacterium]
MTPTRVILGTATPGGGFPAYGAAFLDTVHEFEPTLALEARNTKGSTENVPLLERGEIDLGLVQGEVAYEALTGVGRAPAELRIVAAMYSTPGMFVVRADSAVRTIQDLVGKPVAFGARGSGLVILSRYVLDGLGLDQDRDFQAIYLERAGDGPEMVLDGRAAALWGGGIGWPGFVKVASSAHGARFIAPSADEAKTIQSKHGFLKPLNAPPGSYPGQSATIDSVGSWSFVMAAPGLAPDIGYRIARALDRGQASIATRLAQAAETTPANTVAAAPRVELIDAGVAKYLREIGVLS